MENDHYIRAESRSTKKRVRITENMTKDDAKAWRAMRWNKEFFKYFRVVKDPDYAKEKK